MARTKAAARRGPGGHEGRENGKTPEGRQLNREIRKQKHEEQKRKNTAKATRENSAFAVSPPSPANQSKKKIKKSSLAVSKENKEARESMQLDSTNVASSSHDASTESIGTAQKLTGLEDTHDVASMSIISSSKVEQKVTRALQILSEYPAVPPAKPKVVMLHSKAAVASKMITIAEITKREIVNNGGKWYQYNKLGQVIGERKDKELGARKEKSAGEDVSMVKNGDEEAENASEEEFETMRTPFERAIEGKPKVRAIPVMTLYLSRVRIDSLRKDHTEQTNGMELPMR
ncbi:hypothetical protein N431DRAFT_329171 [Stipitochalara longipes BDJ]|nr:hypothetical protein N431DRAFT_329171 [Stipitochalara longipes BDJ]